MPDLKFDNRQPGGCPIVDVVVRPSTRSLPTIILPWHELTLRMLVDTGAPHSSIAEDLLGSLRLEVRSTRTASAGGTRYTDQVRDVSIELVGQNGSHHIDPMVVGGRDPAYYAGVSFSGILGRDAFNRLTLKWSSGRTTFEIGY